MRSISDALALSMTWAKSLTGSVSSGSGGSAANTFRLKPDTTDARTKPDNTAGRTPDLELRASMRAVDVRDERLERSQVGPEQTFGIGGRQLVVAGQLDDGGDGPAGDAKRPFRVASGRTVFG